MRASTIKNRNSALSIDSEVENIYNEVFKPYFYRTQTDTNLITFKMFEQAIKD